MSSADVKAYEDEMTALVDQAREQLITALRKAASFSGNDKFETGPVFAGAAIQLGAFCNAAAVALSGLVTGDMAVAVRERSRISNERFNETLAEMLREFALAKQARQ